MSLPESLALDWQLDEASTLDFLLAPLDEKPGPRKKAAETDSSAQSQNQSPQQDPGEKKKDKEKEKKKDKKKKEEEEKDEAIDLSIELIDADGDSARVPLSRYGPVRKPLEMHVLRRKSFEDRWFAHNYELVLQSYSILLRDFLRVNPQVNIEKLRNIRFVFDLVPAGTVVLDDVGFSDMPPAFTRISYTEPPKPEK